jgi:hypothetical protein
MALSVVHFMLKIQLWQSVSPSESGFDIPQGHMGFAVETEVLLSLQT